MFSLSTTQTLSRAFSMSSKEECKKNVTPPVGYITLSVFRKASLTQQHPMRPVLPQGLRECLLCVISPNVLNVMTKEGVESILTSLFQVSVAVLKSGIADEIGSNEIGRVIRDGVFISSFGWIPESWVISQRVAPPCHENVQEINDTVQLPDVIGVLVSFIGLASRSRVVFEQIHNTLSNLYE